MKKAIKSPKFELTWKGHVIQGKMTYAMQNVWAISWAWLQFIHTFTHYEYLLNMNVVVSNVNFLEEMKPSLKADG